MDKSKFYIIGDVEKDWSDASATVMYMDWQANRIRQLEEALRQERDRFQPNGWSKAFTEMFESSITSAVNDGLVKIESACVTALDKFCGQMDSSAYDKQ